MATNWTIADRISDRIVGLVNEELQQMRSAKDVQPVQLLAGQLLALKALERTMPPPHPPSVHSLMCAVNSVLSELVAAA